MGSPPILILKRAQMVHVSRDFGTIRSATFEMVILGGKRPRGSKNVQVAGFPVMPLTCTNGTC